MASRVRMALVGCGKIGQRHATSLASIDAVDFVACCDVAEERARTTAAEFGVPRVFTDVGELLRSGLVDAITICTPHPQHAPVLVAAAEAGVHAIVEKPLSAELAEADRMVEAADRAGIKFATIFQRRWFPASQRIRQAIDEGRLGRLTIGECFARLKRDRAYFAQDPWRGRWGHRGRRCADEPGGAHDRSPPVVPGARGRGLRALGATLKHGDYIEVEDTAVATVAFQSGALGVIEATTTYEPPFGFQIAVNGTSGATVGLLERPEGTQAITDVWTFAGEEEQQEAWAAEEGGRPGFPEFHRLQLADFAAAIQERIGLRRSPAPKAASRWR